MGEPKKEKLIIPDYIKTALSALEQRGFKAYLVGGCVRDFLLGNSPSDFDITTDAMPEQTKKCFEGYEVLTNGIKHGTVTPIIAHKAVEITTFRTDGDYSDNRHPDKVEFTSRLGDDLARRDFTVNALAYSEGEGVTDLFGGREDIKNKIIRCVGEADRRFGEDALRILRAMRFASVLGFNIEKETEKSIKKNIKLLKNVSAERIYGEFIKLLNGENASEILIKFPCLCQTLVGIELNGRQKKALKNAKTAEERLAIIFIYSSPELLKPLKPDNKTYKELHENIENYRLRLTSKNMGIKEQELFIFKNGLDYESAEKMLNLKELMGSTLDIKRFEADLKYSKKHNHPIEISELDITGNDLKKKGIKGKKIKLTQEFLLKSVIEGKAKNEKNELLKLI